MKHLKLFKTSKDLQDFKDGKDYVTPYLYYQEQSNEIGVNHKSIPNNEIWYTYKKGVFINNGGGGEEHALDATQPKSKRILGNSEEQAYIPQGPLKFNPNAFNANIVSDDYIDGHGIITFDDDVTIVGGYAFSSCNNLLSITLPQTVSEISDSAFAYCNNLTGVTIPDSVTSIGSYVFNYCTKLTGITIPDSVTSIGSYVFNYCTKLTGITIPDSVTSIGSSAFYNCSSLTTVKIGNGVTIISSQAFYNCYKLTTVEIGSGCTSIGNYAFQLCSNLTGITIPDLVTNIGYYAFQNCDRLTEVTIPDSVSSIGDGAFYDCQGLTTVEIGGGCTSIGNSVFWCCSSLTGITIPNSVTNIGSQAFYNCTNLTTVEIGSGVTSIGNYAFQNCSKLKEITCHANIAPSIGSDTFNNITYCGLLIHPEGSDYSTWLSNSRYYLGYYSWGDGIGEIKCTYNITSTNTPTIISNSTNGIYKMEVDGVEIEPTSAYTFNETGEHIIEFTSLNKILSSAFHNCSSLTSVEIGSGITSISSSAFYNCSNLKEITCHAITAPSINSNTFKGIASYGLLIHPEGSDYSSWLLTDSYYLGYYNWGNKVVEAICTYNITSANTPTNICYSTNGILKMEVDGVEIEPTTGYTFNEIGEHIIEFTFLNNIASNAFYYCSNLTTVEIGSGCTSIGEIAFQYCSNLTGITIPDSVTSIGNSAFQGCSILTGITIPDSVTSIGSRAFEVCYNLTSIIVSSANTVYDSRENCNAIIETATNTLIQGCETTIIPDSVTSIGNYAFSYCYNLTGITIPDSVASIGNNAFYNCDGLTGITIPASVTSIGEFAFYSCDGLTSITMPDSLTNIGKYAFSDSLNLTTVEIGSGCTSIGIYAFSDCPKLKKITCHANTAPSISQSTFRDVAYYGLLIHPEGSNYNRWLSASTYYLGYYSWGDGIGEIKCTYNITSIDEPTRICNYTSGVLKMEVDGVEIEPTSAYTFNEPGEHLVEFDYLNKMRVRAFSNCSSLTNVEIDGERISIGNSAFTNCDGLTTVEIGNGCTSIGNNVFYNCSNLKTIEIGSGITSVGDYAFQNCSSLKEITCHANTAPSISTSTFRGIANYGLLTHPEGSDYSSWLSTSNSYLGYYKWTNKAYKIKNTYNVTSTNTPTKICQDTDGIIKIKINNIDIPISSGYTFNEIGEHVVEFTCVDKKQYCTFDNCYNLTNVEIGSGCTCIGDYIFRACTRLTGITIPDSVTSIGDDVFHWCNSLTGITIPDSVTSIGESAFRDCSNLKIVEIGSGVTGIDGFTFVDCYELTGITIPDSVTSIGNSAFEGCSSLTNLEIGSGCVSIGGYAFYKCSDLTSIVVSSGNTVYDSRENCNAIIKTATNVLIQGCNTTIIPDSVTSIGGNAFAYCSGLTGITIPDSVTSIGGNAFAYCPNLKIVEIGSGVTSIGSGAFESCSKLKEITCHANTAPSISSNTFSYIATYGLLIYPEGSNYSSWLSTSYSYLGYYNWVSRQIGVQLPELTLDDYDVALLVYAASSSVTKICSATTNISEIKVNEEVLSSVSTGYTFSQPYTWNVVRYKFKDNTTISANTFIGITQGCDVNISDTVTTIGNNAFTDCYNVSELILPDTLTTIGNNSFSNCSNLKTVEIGSGCTNIGVNAFYNCSSLTSIIVSSGNTVYDSREDCNAIIETATNKLIQGCKTTIIPDSVTSIGNYAFYNCDELTSITIPDSVTSISGHAFYDCDELTGITIPNSVTSIGSRAFEYCTSLTTVEIGSGCTSIGNYAFNHCSNLTRITIPDSVTSIGDYAFWACSGLTNIEIGSGVTSIGKCVFGECDGLTKVTIPDSVTNIGESAFQNCSKLTTVEIGSGVTSISNGIFYGCANLTGITIPDSVTSIGNTAFYNCGGLTGITIPDSVTSIGGNTFYKCVSLTGITIPDSVTSIGVRAFNYCSSLTTVEIGSGVTNIGNYAFCDCTNLTGITIPNSVTSIGVSTFSNCSNLTSIIVSSANTVYDSRENCNAIIETATNTLIQGCNTTIIPDSVTSIGSVAFGGCDRLTGIMIPDSVTSIGDSAFTSCDRLITVEIGSGVTSIGHYAFYNCDDLTEIAIPNSVKTIGSSAFDDCQGLTTVKIGSGVTSIGSKAFNRCSKLKQIISHAVIAPSISNQVFYSVANNGQLYYPQGSDYSNWLSTNSYYLGYYGWTGDTLYKPETYYDLEITADDVDGRATTTIITWRCLSDGIDTLTNEMLTGVELTGTAISNTFEQNTSETDVIERTITFEYMGLSASTVITQGVWISQYYTLDLNSQWQESTKPNPDSTLYDGVYESFSNKGKDNTAAIMYIDIVGYENFSLYIRSYAEGNYDYVMVSQLDKTINNNSSYSDTTLVKAHTYGYQQSGTALTNYRLVEFTGIDGGEHRITVVYRKDSSAASGDDKGYILIPKN